MTIARVKFVHSNSLPKELRDANGLVDNCMVEVTVTNTVPKVSYRKVNSVMETIREKVSEDHMLGTKFD